ncbi:ARF1-directed GTPase-activating protein, putative [Eimeria acervulina]|uniref:ARF1-directed GTPase-activating protein, putative n=1 Tax=Eimeria acervulina TaxID=5801 RepID=U6GLU7_EIMAC|nr:ARF1-directed GTPase-activating protein, putative [Eimeria acervulina]CDI80268.1 ARF1-directed GTPase-activating protein, putative [Eimeria acervulina]
MDGQTPTAAIAAAAAALSGADPAGARKQLALLYQKLPVDDRRYVSESDRDEIFRRLRKDNRMCFDCSARNPTWISLTHAVYVCLSCSGKHRRLGTHLSFVRSTEMDKIYPEQLFRMELGGNRRAQEFLREQGADLSQPLDYHGKLAAKHRQVLDRLVNSEMQSIGWLVGGQQDSSASHKTGAAAQQQQQQLQQQVRDALHGSKQPVQQQAQPGPAVVPVAAVAAVAPPAAPAVTVGTGRGNVVDNSLGGSMKPMGAGRGVRSRKLEMDFDFEKEAALLAAKQRAAAQGSPHTSGSSSQPPTQQQTAGRGGFNSIGSESSSLPRAATNPTFGSGGSTGLGQGASVGSGYGSSSNPSRGAYGSNSTRFSGAKSISSAQYFNQEESSPPVAPVPVDPSRRAIGSDEVFGRSNSGRRGWEDQSSARVEALRMHAQQGWQQLSQAGSEALSKAREWLAGT